MSMKLPIHLLISAIASLIHYTSRVYNIIINNLLHNNVMIIIDIYNRKNDLILIMAPDKQDKTLELSKHWSPDSTLAGNEVIMKTTYAAKSVKHNKICSNY